jgi:hypothetical protein
VRGREKKRTGEDGGRKEGRERAWTRTHTHTHRSQRHVPRALSIGCAAQQVSRAAGRRCKQHYTPRQQIGTNTTRKKVGMRVCSR